MTISNRGGVTALTVRRWSVVRRAWLLVAAALAVLATAVTPLPAFAAATPGHSRASAVVVTGRVADQDGRGVARVRVEFSDDDGGLIAFFRALGCVVSAYTTLGLAPSDPQFCGPDVVTTTSASDGSFRLLLPAGSPVAEAGLHHLFLTGHAAAPHLAAATTSRDVAYRGGRLALGTTLLWQPHVTVRELAGKTSITIPPARGTKEDTTAPIIGTDGGVAWHVKLDESGAAAVDDRVLETGTRAVTAFATSDHTRYVAWQWPLTPTGTPTSRGKACSTYLVNGGLASFAHCPFSDGRLGTALGLRGALKATPHNACSGSSCAQPDTLVVDLHEIRTLKAVVWRGCVGCHVPELSLDGVNWLQWPGASVSGGDEGVVTGLPTPARYVRVSGSVFIFWDLRELSLWTDPLLPPPLRTAGAAHPCRYAGTGAAGCPISSASGLRGVATTLSNKASTSTPPISSITAPIRQARS